MLSTLAPVGIFFAAGLASPLSRGRLSSSRSHKHCPSCKEEWDAPLYDVSDVEGGGLSDHTGDATTVLDVEDDDE